MYENLCEAWPAIFCADITGYSTEVTGAAMLAATELLWEKTGRKFGNCPVVLRPCRSDCIPTALPTTWGVQSGGLSDFFWYGVLCGNCLGQCGCTSSSEVRFPDPVTISDVTIDGVSLPASGWSFYDGMTLIKTEGQWPLCQEWHDTSGEGVWTVTVTLGSDVPELGKLAVGILGVELMKAACGEECALPHAVTSVTRRGVSFTIDQDSPTGLYLPDKFISTFNPSNLQDRSRAWNPDDLA